MITVNLTRADINYAEKVISKQVMLWAKKEQFEVFEIRNGLLAEYAVTKYFNETLGAVPRVEFRVNYVDGKDGGFDFQHHGVTYDVKESRTGIFTRAQLRKTSAQVIVATKLITPEKVEIFGYCPVSKLPSTEEVPIDCFRSLDELGKLTAWFNSNFTAHPKQNDFDCTSDMGDMFYYILEKARKRQELKCDESL